MENTTTRMDEILNEFKAELREIMVSGLNSVLELLALRNSPHVGNDTKPGLEANRRKEKLKTNTNLYNPISPDDRQYLSKIRVDMYEDERRIKVACINLATNNIVYTQLIATRSTKFSNKVTFAVNNSSLKSPVLQKSLRTNDFVPCLGTVKKKKCFN